MNIRLNRFIQVAYPVLVYYLLYNILTSVFHMILGDRVSELTCLLFASIITAIVIYFIYRKLPIVKAEIQFSVHDLKRDLIYILIIVATGIALNLFVTYTPLNLFLDNYNSSTEILYSGDLYIKILANAIFIPILEELIFRGIVCGQLSMWYGNRCGVIISAVLFGIMHFNVIQFLYAFLMGLLLAYVYNSTKKLWVTSLAHGLTNFIVIIFTFIS